MELTLSHLTKVYTTGIRALDDLSVTLTTGVHGILGPNGAGKSTLMQILTYNLNATEGDVLWNGKSIWKDRQSYCTNLGYMPQQQAMYPTFTAKEYLQYMGRLKQINPVDLSRAINQSLEQVGLQDVAYKRIATFSGGMKQRLLLAQAILAKPSILILDEPTAGLDPHQRIAIRNIISQMAADTVILLATHVVSDVEIIARDILLLDHGRLLHFDAPGRLCQQLHGKVYEVVLEDSFIDPQWRVSSMRQRMDGKMVVRILTDTPPVGYEGHLVEPSLEDVFLQKVGTPV